MLIVTSRRQRASICCRPAGNQAHCFVGTTLQTISHKFDKTSFKLLKYIYPRLLILEGSFLAFFKSLIHRHYMDEREPNRFLKWSFCGPRRKMAPEWPNDGNDFPFILGWNMTCFHEIGPWRYLRLEKHNMSHDHFSSSVSLTVSLQSGSGLVKWIHKLPLFYCTSLA